MREHAKETILQVQNLSVNLLYEGLPIKVVDDLSFDLHKGKTIAIVGESGCGKSMTALSIMRILPQPPVQQAEGKILYQGKDILSLKKNEMRKIRGSRIAMIFQDPMSALNPVYTIGSQLLEVALLHMKLTENQAIKRILESLKEVGIKDPERVALEYPHKLSGGMKQRVMIAMALICEPDILIADEPTTALDVTVQKQVLDLIKQLQKRKGTALVLITHDMGVVAEMADDVIVMYSSRSVEQGNVFDIFDNMLHPYTKGLFLSRPHCQKKAKKLYSIEGNVPSIAQRPKGCHFLPRCDQSIDPCRKGIAPNVKIHSSKHKVLCHLC